MSADDNFSRLPSNVVPNHYFLKIIPNLNAFEFSGEETVSVDVREKTNKIILNALDIKIQSASFVSNDKEQPSTDIQVDNSKEIALITFENALDVGKGQLKLRFTGEINDLLKGCYRCKYAGPDGDTRYGLATQMESVYCRRAFPCWDEPALRAKFDLTLVAPKDRVVLSNTPIVEEIDYELDNTQKVVKFGTTPLMSTYLVGYVIGEYDYVEQKSKNNTLVRVYTPVNKKEQGQFALDVSVRCLDLFEEYFQIPYPLPKLDLIGLSDFEINGMENWGLITYRQTTLLYDPQNSSDSIKERIALVIAHEVSHQWFGNLVTMEWWTHLWLKEGFASFMMYYAVDKLMPELNVWQQFVIDSVSLALELDALHTSHPIEVPVVYAHEVEEIFDAISYKKGASVIRMIYYYIGDEDFQKGLHNYLTKFAYKNTITENLWTSLEEASGKPIASIMKGWTIKKGYPTINVTSRQDGSKRVLTLSQEKFSANGQLSEEDQQSQWLVPLSIITQNNPKPVKVLLENRTQEITLENVEPSEWVKVNPEATTLCITNYTPELLEKFKQSIVDKSLATMDRLNLQSDLFAVVKSGKVGSDRYLKFIESYVNETCYPVWSSIIDSLAEFNNLLAHTDYQQVFHVYVRNLLSKIYDKVGMKPVAGESHQDSLLRTRIVSMLVSVEEPRVLKEAKSQFESHCSKVSLIAPNVRSPVYRSIAKNCDDKTWDQLFRLFRDADLHEEKNRIANSLGASKDADRLRKVIDFAVSEEVRSQDAVSVLSSVASHKLGRSIAWAYFKKNVSLFKKKYSTGPLLRHLVKGLIFNFVTEEHLQDVSAFFAEHSLPSTERTTLQSIENIKLNASWLSRDSKVIKDYLTSQ